MSHHWLLITFSWFGTASLQYINTGGPAADSILDSPESPVHYSLANTNYFDQPQRDDFEIIQGDEPTNNYNGYNSKSQDLQRKRRTVNEKEKDRQWQPNLIDTDRTAYIETDNKVMTTPFVAELPTPDENGTDMNIIEALEKKQFSPWGGKRDNKPTIEHMWTWKRASNVREPSMPKRVRFSPWGGKRSGQMIFKPGSKGSKIIFATSFPELTRIVSNFSPNGQGLNIAGFQFVPSLDKRHPFRVLSLSTQLEDKLRDALPFKMFMENLPKLYKPGHPYLDVHLKKDGKRKSKFSAWGGKRSPPIIGPIWVPTRQAATESVLNTILLLRSNQDPEAILKATQ